jgi:hypothetical protein
MSVPRFEVSRAAARRNVDEGGIAMKRTAWAGMVLASAAALAGLTVPAYANGPASHFEEDVTGDTLVCESTTYAITSGSIQIVIHEGEAASGNQNVTGTITPQDVVAEDSAGNTYSVRGALWFGGAVNAQQGTMVFTDTAKLQIISQGSGTVDSVNVTFHVTTVNGNVKAFDFGTCEEPEEEE